MQSVEKQIERSIKAKPKGMLVFPEDFASYGSSESVRKALDRLEDKKLLIRVAQGIRDLRKTQGKQTYWLRITYGEDIFFYFTKNFIVRRKR